MQQRPSEAPPLPLRTTIIILIFLMPMLCLFLGAALGAR
jgi:uncharacterized membrane protein